MSNQTETLKSFLVSLGFSIDQNGLRMFVGTLASVESQAGRLATRMIGIGVAAEQMVRTVAHSYEDLYYVSKRTNASVGNIKALENASEQVGVKAEQARAALEGMAAVVRDNPMKRSLIDALIGNSSKDMDQVEVLMELVKSINEKFPYFIGKRFAAQFGIDEETFFQLTKNMKEFEKAFIRMKALQQGDDMDEWAKAGREYSNALKDIGNQAEQTAGRVGMKLLPAFKFLATWLRRRLKIGPTLQSKQLKTLRQQSRQRKLVTGRRSKKSCLMTTGKMLLTARKVRVRLPVTLAGRGARKAGGRRTQQLEWA